MKIKGAATIDTFSFLRAVRLKRPLVHHITNWVTIYDCAQVVKSFGASPVMAHAPEEVAEITAISSSLVLNIGTLSTELVESMKIAAFSANKRRIPVILDVCGAGASSFRDRKCMELLNETRISVIKGNASEIARIAGLDVQTKGVDSAPVRYDLRKIAASLAQVRNCTVVVTRKEDIVTDPDRSFLIRNGHEMMSSVVGAGCMATSVIGAFAGAVPQQIAEAAAAGLICFEVAAELAVRQARGPASLKQTMLDCIYHLSEEELLSYQKVEECRIESA
ncbi:MAG: hydroxyethylthiazole kinase [Coprothermobacterota bacterium]|nr:hydroxyethylthiazole kinase [Coprothermobacterota bacterium]